MWKQMLRYEMIGNWDISVWANMDLTPLWPLAFAFGIGYAWMFFAWTSLFLPFMAIVICTCSALITLGVGKYFLEWNYISLLQMSVIVVTLVHGAPQMYLMSSNIE